MGKRYKNKRTGLNKVKARNSLESALGLWDNRPANIAQLYENYSYNLISQRPELLTSLFNKYGVMEKIVSLPVDDAYKKGGFEYSSTQLDGDDLKYLQKFIKKKNIIGTLKTAQKWARLYGGAALILLGGGEIQEPVDFVNLHEYEVEFIAVDRWQLNYSESNINIPDGTWTLTNYATRNATYGAQVHPSRIMPIKGAPAPYLVDLMVQGWGVSAYESIYSDLTQYFKGTRALFECIDECKIDILKLDAFETAIASAQGEQALRRTVDLIADNKNFKSMITMPKSDDYEQKQLSLSGMGDIFKEIRVLMSGSSCIPVNKLWGEGITGFGSGEDSLENYNSLIENQVRNNAENALEWIHKICCYTLFGYEVEDLEYEWASLRVLSAIDEQNIKDHKLANIMQLYDRQLISPQEAMKALKEQKLFTMETKALAGEKEDLPLFPDNTQGFTEIKDITAE